MGNEPGVAFDPEGAEPIKVNPEKEKQYVAQAIKNVQNEIQGKNRLEIATYFYEDKTTKECTQVTKEGYLTGDPNRPQRTDSPVTPKGTRYVANAHGHSNGSSLSEDDVFHALKAGVPVYVGKLKGNDIWVQGFFPDSDPTVRATACEKIVKRPNPRKPDYSGGELKQVGHGLLQR